MSMISINHNQAASNLARTLQSHYGRLESSVRRLATGLRVNSGADDAAGIAVRELMRSNIAALKQGMRNASDAISMIQIADGALGVIDEKLIRMKELAEQAATGTYNSDQRLMIDSEFQAMGSEIDRIARATDFNGLHLLDGSLSGAHDGGGLESSGRMKIHFGTANDSAEDYYYVEIGKCTTKGLGLRNPRGPQTIIRDGVPEWITKNAIIDYDQKKIFYDIPHRLAGTQDRSPQGVPGLDGIDYYQLPVGLENIVIISDTSANSFAHKPHVNLFTKDGMQLTGVNPDEKFPPGGTQNGSLWWNGKNSTAIINNLVGNDIMDNGAKYDGTNIINNAGQSVSGGGSTVSMVTSQTNSRGNEEIHIDKVTSDLVFLIGGHAGPGSNNCNHYKLTITADLGDDFFSTYLPGSLETDEGDLISIARQDMAQQALERLDRAIVSKDAVRANLGALQNRLENTITNLTIQSENLLAAESRISDADVATEMTNFVRNQILTQSAVAMLGQANSFSGMMASLLNR